VDAQQNEQYSQQDQQDSQQSQLELPTTPTEPSGSQTKPTRFLTEPAPEPTGISTELKAKQTARKTALS